MPHAYTEDQLVEQPAIGLFAELGWTIAFGNPHPGPLPAGEGGVGLLPSAIGRGGGGISINLNFLTKMLPLPSFAACPTMPCPKNG